MNTRQLHILLVLCIAVVMTSAFAADTTPDVNFVVPKGWPEPVYDFSKNPLTEDGFKLGRKLFFDPALSRDSSTSCASCHLQFTGFTHVDHALSHGINGLKGTRNSLTIFNEAWSTSFMWDGGVHNLELQPLAPITNAVEMDSKIADVVAKLNSMPSYRGKFAKAFGDSTVTGQRMLKALTQFIVMLQSYNSKYDKYIRKEPGGEMTAQEMNGLLLFRQNCASCHKEPLFTNNGFENNGLAADTELNDRGRMKITRNRDDSLKFKVPSLRNVAMSYPYMHDGRFHSLEQVLDHYTNGIVISRTLSPLLKKPLSLSVQDKKNIIAFLQTLTDKDFLFDLRFRNYPD
ncbi:cytochrome-c peroxidase [Chitinophagaceae bacterium MMS25-I14]